MEDFKKKLMRRLLLLTAGLLIACVALVLTRNSVKAATTSVSLQGFIAGFQAGYVAAIFGVLLVLIVRNTMALRAPERLKKLYISETDERKMFIRQMSGSAGMDVIGYGLAVGAAVSGNINDTVFFSLLGACFFVALVRGFLKLYYRARV